MASHRDFLDWDTPALPATVGWLAGRHTRDGVLDLSGQLLVLPGARAGRRLLELLVDHAAATLHRADAAAAGRAASRATPRIHLCVAGLVRATPLSG